MAAPSRRGTGRLRLTLAFAEADRAGDAPAGVALKPGSKATLRDALGVTLNHYNRISGGAFAVSAADLLGSTSVNKVTDGFAPGFFNRRTNPDSRTLAIGGICEDAMAAMASGIATFGSHSAVVSSYGAFMAPLGHIAARLHAIGNQAPARHRRRSVPAVLPGLRARRPQDRRGWPTHADPQPLQLLQGNFPLGTDDHADAVGPAGALAAGVDRAGTAAGRDCTVRDPAGRDGARSRGARPAPASASVKGVYRLRAARGRATASSCCRVAR